MKRFVVAYLSDYVGKIELFVVEAENAFWAAVQVIQEQGWDLDDDTLSTCEESLITLEAELDEATINVIEV